ncbi:MAG: response regulator transcription factor [Anaerolineales bacterium]|jgi:DNA-binding NarL/FixJ family response regulator|nr:response regulator transcription factor [Anaerolineales bacterium]
MSAIIRVVLADDHPLAREGIKNFLLKAVDIEVVGEAQNGRQALQMVSELKPDVLLLDMEMPDIKGIEVAQQLKASASPVHILALSAHDDKQYIFGLLEAGACGYLTKDEIPESILDAVRGVACGEQGWVSRRVAAVMSVWPRSDPQKNNLLTERELEVLGPMVDGKTNKEIGYDLGISQKTVEKHLESIYAKLKVNSRVEAAVLAVKEGFFSPRE